MPSIFHAIFGGVVGIFFYYTSREGRRIFNERMIIILAFNSFMGPDLFKIPRLFLFPDDATLLALDHYLHSVFGWLTWAPVPSLAWWLLAGIRASYPDSTTFFNTVKIVGAAGIMHLGLDVLDASGTGVYSALRVIPWLESTRFNLDTFHTGWTFQEGPLPLTSRTLGVASLFFIGVVFLVVLARLLSRKRMRQALLVAGIFVAGIMLLIILFGSKIVASEHDLGYMVYFSTFFFIPALVLYWAMQDRTVMLDARIPWATCLFKKRVSEDSQDS